MVTHRLDDGGFQQVADLGEVMSMEYWLQNVTGTAIMSGV
jgi:hypothetical protein